MKTTSDLFRLFAPFAGLMLTAGTTTPARAQTQDFSRGFDLMVKLGLPDTKGWKYVKTGAGEYDSIAQRLDKLKLSGDAWMEPEAGADGLVAISADGVSLSALPLKEPETMKEQSEIARKLAAAGLGYEMRVRSLDDAKPADEKADAEALTAAVIKALGDEDGRDGILRDQGTLATLFFRAAHWHRRGMPEPAAKLVQALFDRLPRKAALIEAAMGRLASERLGVALLRFQGTGDWKALETDLQAVIADFPKMWQERPLAERLLGQVKARAAGQAAPLTSSADFPLTEAQVAWWEKVTGLGRGEGGKDEDEGEEGDGEMDMERLGTLWAWKQLPWPAESLKDGEEGWYASQLKGKLFDLTNGWDWTGVMAAALGDQTLTSLGMENQRYRSNYFSSYHDPEDEPEELSEEELAQHWSQMNRPRTRDDLARAFLKGAIPQSEDRDYDWWETTEADELRETAKEWRDKLAGKKDREIVDLYFAEGGEQEKKWAAGLLARTGTDADLAKLEELTLKSPREALELATEIVKRKKEGAKAYLDKFSAKLKEEIAAQNREYRKDQSAEELEKEFDQYYGRQLKPLQAIVSGKGFADMLAAYLEGKSKLNDFQGEIRALEVKRWKQGDAEAMMGAVLKKEGATPAERSTLLQYATYMVRSAIAPEGEENEEPAPPGGDEEEMQEDVKLPDWVIGGFRQMVEGGGEILMPSRGEMLTLSQLALYQVDTLANGGKSRQAAQAFRSLPNKLVWRHFEERGRARLEGRPAPEVPDVKSLPAEKKTAIEANLSKVGTPGWAAYAESLPAIEAMVLRDAIEAREEPDPAWQKANLTVADVKGGGAEKWAGLKGKVMDGTFVRQLLDLCEKQLAEREVTGGSQPGPLLTGMVLTVQAEADEDDQYGNSIGGQLKQGMQAFGDGDGNEVKPDFTAIAWVMWYARNERGSAVRLLGMDGKWKTHSGDEAPTGLRYLPFEEPVADADLDKVFGDFLSGDGKEGVILQFGVVPMPKPEKKKSE